MKGVFFSGRIYNDGYSKNPRNCTWFQEPILGTRYSVPGTRYSIPGTGYSVPETKYLYSSWNRVFISWNRVLGFYHWVFGSWTWMFIFVCSWNRLHLNMNFSKKCNYAFIHMSYVGSCNVNMCKAISVTCIHIKFYVWYWFVHRKCQFTDVNFMFFTHITVEQYFKNY